MVKITYIYHSCYVVEMEDRYLLFDYCKGVLPEFDSNKPVYVFVSHRHEDHYQPMIFEWRNSISKIKYVLSDDIDAPIAKDCRRMKPDEVLKLDDMKIETFFSSDEGVAFLIQVNGISIYHAGDLNWWHWEEENTREENEEAKALFERGMHKLKGRHIDVAFLVLDPRQQHQFYYGFDAFMTQTQTSHAFPMHMWGNYTIVEKLKRLPQSAGYRDAIMDVEKENQQFTIEVS